MDNVCLRNLIPHAADENTADGRWTKSPLPPPVLVRKLADLKVITNLQEANPPPPPHTHTHTEDKVM